MSIEKIISDFAEEQDILLGICGAEPLTHLRDSLSAKTPFVRFSPDERMDPSLSFPSAKSIIVAAVGYRKRHSFLRDNKQRGEIALYAAGEDYHKKLETILTGLALLISQVTPFEFRINVDTGPLPEKELARKCGLGFIGRNNLLITERFGSYVNLGYMISDLRLEPTVRSSAFSCGDCLVCVKNCPGGALSGTGGFNYKNCVSYITQTRGKLTAAQKLAMGNHVFGCDICQKVCKYNENAEFVGEITDAELLFPELDGILEMDYSGFRHNYGNTACGWVGPGTLKRNAGIAKSGWKSIEISG